MKNLLMAVLVIIGLAILTSCAPHDTVTPPCATPASIPVASSNSPVIIGGTINLTTPTVAGATYRWTGPDYFTSNLQNPTIGSASMVMKGTYSVVVTVGDCVSQTGTTLVTVTPPPPTCTPTNNTANYFGLPTLSFTYISGGATSDSYDITANSSNGDLTISFAGASLPTNGAYVISTATFLSPGQVYVSTVTGGTFSTNYVATSGYVFVTVASGKVTTLFCDVPFETAFTGSAKVTVQ